MTFVGKSAVESLQIRSSQAKSRSNAMKSNRFRRTAKSGRFRWLSVTFLMLAAAMASVGLLTARSVLASGPCITFTDVPSVRVNPNTHRLSSYFKFVTLGERISNNITQINKEET